MVRTIFADSNRSTSLPPVSLPRVGINLVGAYGSVRYSCIGLITKAGADRVGRQPKAPRHTLGWLVTSLF